MAENPTAQELFKIVSFLDPKIIFNSCLWTYNPQKGFGARNVPFILWPHQEVAIDKLKAAIDTGFDVAIDKTRKQGASEILTKLFMIYWLMSPETYFLIGSRKEELVDQSVELKHGRVCGSHQTLFHKILYGIANLPVWWKMNFSKRHRFLQNLDNGSMIEGEATSESFGAGNRATAVLVDECARIEPEVAQFIIDNIHDTTNCCIYNSTHFRWGAGHPYSKLLRSNKIEVITLGYEENPTENIGLYRSPKSGWIEIKDIDYYRQKCPAVFSNVHSGQLISVDWLENQALQVDDDVQEQLAGIRFIADGGESNFGKWRSVWFDEQAVDRARSLMDIAQNILRVPQGSADMFFDNGMLERIRTKFVHKPDIKGDIEYQFDPSGRVINEKFVQKSKGRLHWWGKLVDGKPDSAHNYVVACDISYGKGASNSVAAICDVNTQELVGLLVDPFVNIGDFANLSIALCKWAGNAFLIWEANGPGNEFDHNIRKQRYPKVYIPKPERMRVRQKQNKRGWQSTPGINGTKIDMLNRLDSALLESLRSQPMGTLIIVHDESTLNELMDYIFEAKRIDVNPSSNATDTSGARYAHGDRVIAVGLCVVAMEECPKKITKKSTTPPRGSFQYRFDEWKEQRAKEKMSGTTRKVLW